ncbi:MULTISPECIES: YdbL family protein [unclassified Thioalkalivibrio]|uniref:YdbL family protein n=1 Tax=unclassified Thioalkalivibrio TaxID=2621013 RepID=UPI0003824A3F|nr:MULTISPECIES: YdbL family protein [unclassified Thioalkalivibrio]
MKAWFGVPALALLSALVAGCVTINIYFPAAAAEDAARAIVRDALQLHDIEELREPESAPEMDGGSSDAGSPDARDAAGERSTPLLARLLETLVAPAAASNPDLQIETPAINRIRASMRDRAPQLAPHFRSGAIGFGADGDVAIRDLSEVPLRERSEVQRLVSEENADRASLYREIARANDRPDWEARIRETFARVWVDEAPAGYWYRSDGQWRQK